MHTKQLPKIGDKVLATTNAWFFAPDGDNYNAVFGTLNGIYTDQETLGIKTNAKSTNWYAHIGDMIIAGCQIHYAIKTDCVSFDPPLREIDHDGKINFEKSCRTRIYNADA